MYCAARAAETGLSAAVAEHGKSLGRKLGITGKGRCNITNNCDPETVLKNVPRNPRFLYSALSKCSPADVMEYFEGLGVPLKTERGQRVFPVSDKAGDVVNALENQLRRLNVEIIRGNCTRLVIEDGRCAGALISGREVRARAVVLATGGLSYPLTGSDGSGYALAQQAGHTVTERSPSLIPMETEERWVSRAAGLDLRNVSMKLMCGGKAVYEDFGELLFTAYGVGGPTILSASAHIPAMEPGKYSVVIDLKPALSEKQLDARILRDFGERKGMRFADSLRGLLPAQLAPVVRDTRRQKGRRGHKGAAPRAGKAPQGADGAYQGLPPGGGGYRHQGRRLREGDKPQHDGEQAVSGAVFRRGDHRLRRLHRRVQPADRVRYGVLRGARCFAGVNFPTGNRHLRQFFSLFA